MKLPDHQHDPKDIYRTGVPERDFVWVCNECNSPNLTSSVSEDEIEQELHACINCGCVEMHKRYFR